MVVDLPAPFGPRRATVSPGATSRQRSSTASRAPYRWLTPSKRKAGVDAGRWRAVFRAKVLTDILGLSHASATSLGYKPRQAPASV